MVKKKAATKKQTIKVVEGVSKSQLIRDYLAAHPEAKNKAVSEALTATGVEVSPQDVANQKTLARKKAGKSGSPTKGKGKGKDKIPTKAIANKMFDDLMLAKEFAAKVGGIKYAQIVLAHLETLNVPF